MVEKEDKGIYEGIIKERLQGAVGEWRCREKDDFGLMMKLLTETRRTRGASARMVKRR